MNYGIVSFDSIANEIINNDYYKKLKKENHHGLTRYEHSIRVAKQTYILSKKLNIDYISATRAALLHDFFLNDDFGEIKGIKKGTTHPKIALENSKKHFNLNKKEEEAILSHMFPLTLVPPLSLEGAVLSLTDKGTALYEYGRFKLTLAFSIWILFIFNFLTLNNN
ncbi:MAG: HD domain-containing protein [Bacilli bacterium]|nr:HD domain-containing protein [Bacilli bacterium]